MSLCHWVYQSTSCYETRAGTADLHSKWIEMTFLQRNFQMTTIQRAFWGKGNKTIKRFFLPAEQLISTPKKFYDNLERTFVFK